MILFQFFNDNFFKVSNVLLVGAVYSGIAVYSQRIIYNEEHEILSQWVNWLLANLVLFIYHVFVIFFIKKMMLKKESEFDGF